MANSSRATSSGCTSATLPSPSAVPLSTLPTIAVPTPSSHSGWRASQNSRLGRSDLPGGDCEATRCCTTEPMPNSAAAPRASR